MRVYGGTQLKNGKWVGASTETSPEGAALLYLALVYPKQLFEFILGLVITGSIIMFMTDNLKALHHNPTALHQDATPLLLWVFGTYAVVLCVFALVKLAFRRPVNRAR